MPRGLNSFSCFYCMCPKHICRILAGPADAPNQPHPQAPPLHLTLQVVETCSHHSLSPPAGSWGVNASPLAPVKRHAALASKRTPILSLARVEALHHSSVLLYSPAVSCRICLHRGLLKSPGKDESKNRTGPVSPASRKLLQTSPFH